MSKKKSYGGKTWGSYIRVLAHSTGYLVYWWAKGMGTTREGKPFCRGGAAVFRIGTLPDFITQRMAVLDMVGMLDEIAGVGHKAPTAQPQTEEYFLYLTPDEKPVLLDFIERNGVKR